MLRLKEAGDKMVNSRALIAELERRGYLYSGNNIFPPLAGLPEDYPWTYHSKTGPVKNPRESRLDFPLPCIWTRDEEFTLVNGSYPSVAKYHQEIGELQRGISEKEGDGE